MASHDLEHQPSERLITQLHDLTNQVRELRTLQLQGKSAVPLDQYSSLDGVTAGPFEFDLTVAAGAVGIKTIALRHTQDDTTTTNWNQLLQPAVSVWVDTVDPDTFLDDDPSAWPLGSALTTNEKKLLVSIVRDWAYGLTSQDPQNNDVFHVQLHNLDSVSHTYYCRFRLYGMVGLSPFIELVP